MKIVIIQTGIEWENPGSNLLKLDRMIDDSVEGYDLILLPEMFTTGFTMKSFQMAERMDGVSVTWMQETARKKDAAIAGSLIIVEEGQYFNRLVFVTPGGDIACYDKAHLFSIGGENNSYSKGNSQLIKPFRGVNISFQICYDLRFPVWSRNIDNSYDLLVNVANWPKPRIGVWKTLLAARAIENQCYVAGVNRTGTDEAGNIYTGDSLLIDPMGKIISSADKGLNTLIKGEISMDYLSAFREKFPVWHDQDDFVIKSAL